MIILIILPWTHPNSLQLTWDRTKTTILHNSVILNSQDDLGREKKKEKENKVGGLTHPDLKLTTKLQLSKQYGTPRSTDYKSME